MNSSFISNLLLNDHIPSSAIGLFFGSRSQIKGLDGSLVLGGVDRVRIAGTWTNFTTQAHYTDARCPLQVLVKDVRLNNERGSFSLFADSAATVVACIDPLQNQFTFTQTMYNVFASLTNHPTDPTIEGGSNFTEQTYPLSAAPLLGNLTVELSNGYITEIPNYELVSQERGTDAQGKYAVINDSRLMVAAGTTGTSTLGAVQIPVLGGVYLSQNYLMVDYDSGVFRLAPALLGEMDKNSSHIVKVCGGMEVDDSTSSSLGKKGGPKSTSIASPIAGGVVGGLSVLVVIGLLFRWYRKKKKQPLTDAARPFSDTLDTREDNSSSAPELYMGGLAQDPTNQRPAKPRTDVVELENSLTWSARV